MKTENERLYESYDDNWRRLYFNSESQGFVVAHKKHGKDELPSNRILGIRLAKYFGERIELLPRLFGEHLKSADANRNDETWEWKTTNGSYTSVQNRLRVGSHQCGRLLLVFPALFFPPNKLTLPKSLPLVFSKHRKRSILIDFIIII